MAIHDEFEANLVIDGQNVKEYNPPKSEADHDGEAGQASPLVCRYVEAEEGRNFQVKCIIKKGYKFSRRTDAIGFYVYVDGNYADSITISKTTYQTSSQYEYAMVGRRTGGPDGWFIEMFCFSRLDISQDTVTGDLEELKRYNTKGTIRVEIWPLKGHLVDIQKRDMDTLYNLTVPEKALKGRAITTAAGLGPRQPGHRISGIWDGHRKGSHALVTFLFEHRTKKSLQELLIIERTPSPPPLRDRDPDTLTEVELRQLVREQQSMLKHHPSVMKGEDNLGIKRERDLVEYEDNEVQIVKKIKEVRVPEEVIEIDSE